MRLIDLKPEFLRYRKDDSGTYYDTVDTISEAHGILFKCPKCFVANGGIVGTHSVICWSRSVPDEASPKPGRWILNGTSFEDLSLDAYKGSSRSVLLQGRCAWHGFVTNGEVSIL